MGFCHPTWILVCNILYPVFMLKLSVVSYSNTNWYIVQHNKEGLHLHSFVRCMDSFVAIRSLIHVTWLLSGHDQDNSNWKHTLLISFIVIMWVATIVQCSTGSDVLRWRSFYASHDIAWRAHYREVFDHGIREVLCCLGRVKYSYVSLWNYLVYPTSIAIWKVWATLLFTLLGVY